MSSPGGGGRRSSSVARARARRRPMAWCSRQRHGKRPWRGRPADCRAREGGKGARGPPSPLASLPPPFQGGCTKSRRNCGALRPSHLELGGQHGGYVMDVCVRETGRVLWKGDNEGLPREGLPPCSRGELSSCCRPPTLVGNLATVLAPPTTDRRTNANAASVLLSLWHQLGLANTEERDPCPNHLTQPLRGPRRSNRSSGPLAPLPDPLLRPSIESLDASVLVGRPLRPGVAPSAR